jgi:hypothetical protein
MHLRCDTSHKIHIEKMQFQEMSLTLCKHQRNVQNREIELKVQICVPFVPTNLQCILSLALMNAMMHQKCKKYLHYDEQLEDQV